MTASNDEWHDHALAFFQLCHSTPDFDDDAHRLMAEHIACFHRRLIAIEKMEVRATDRGGGDFDDCVRRFLDHRIGNCVDANVVFTVPAECSHSMF